MPAATQGTWSTAAYTSFARLLTVGVATGGVAGAWTGALSYVLADGPAAYVELAVLYGFLAGMVLGLLVVALSALTALTVAVRRPESRRGTVLALLLVWPVLLGGAAAWLVLGAPAMAGGLRLLGLALVEVVVVAAVWGTARWVTAPLTGTR